MFAGDETTQVLPTQRSAYCRGTQREPAAARGPVARSGAEPHVYLSLLRLSAFARPTGSCTPLVP